MAVFIVDVSWRVSASIEVEADNEPAATALALRLPLSAFPDRDYIDDSFTVDQVETGEEDNGD